MGKKYKEQIISIRQPRSPHLPSGLIQIYAVFKRNGCEYGFDMLFDYDKPIGLALTIFENELTKAKSKVVDGSEISNNENTLP